MLLPILSFPLLLWTFCNCERECVKCDGRVISPDKTCSNCTGDYCYSVMHSNVHPSLKVAQSYYQGCFTSPTELPLGCTRNKQGSVFCICNDTDYCNELMNMRNEKNLTYLTCYTANNGLWHETRDCVHPWCYKKATSYTDELAYCNEEETEIEMYDIGFLQDGMLLPINSCYSIAVDSRYDKDQHCTFKTNKTTPFKQKVPGNIKCFAKGDTKYRMKNSTCVGQFCFSADADFGCISQFNREGAVLKAGLYHLTPFITPFHICDSDFCNNQTVVDDVEDRHYYPTRYVWNSGRRSNQSILSLILMQVVYFVLLMLPVEAFS